MKGAFVAKSATIPAFTVGVVHTARRSMKGGIVRLYGMQATFIQ